MMDREEAIAIISSLYPADSQWVDTNEIGRTLLAQAKEEVNGWRTESTEILIRYAHLCMRKENQGF